MPVAAEERASLRGVPDSTPRSGVEAAIADFQAGVRREESFRLLMELYSARIERFFLRRGRSREDAQDLNQETWRRVFESLDGFGGERAFEHWLFRIAKTTWLRRLRMERAAKRCAAEETLDELNDRGIEPGSPADQLEACLNLEQLEALREAVDELAPQMRRCLYLRVYQDRSVHEIAAILRLSEGAVKAHLFLARARLRARLGRYFGEPREHGRTGNGD